MKKNMVISIIVPIYNVYEYLDKCIKSLIEQTYKNIQIILVDDGSTDGSSEICDKYAEIDSRIIVIHQSNAGTLCARKAGTQMAAGKYVLYVDADDWIDKDRVENFVKISSDQNADMVYMKGMIKEYGDNNMLCSSNLKEGLYTENQIKEDIIKKIVDLKEFYKVNVQYSLCVWGIKKELIQKQNEIINNQIALAEDVISVCACLMASKSVYVMYEPGYHYIQYRNTSSTYKERNLNQERGLFYLWNNFKRITPQSEEEIYQVFVFLMNIIVALADYSIFLRRTCDYLYPYPNVKKGSDIVVYGAGKLGYKIVEALAKSKDYNIVAWVDQSTNRLTIQNYKIVSLNDIHQMEYDFIIIAIFNYDTVKKVKQNLLEKGIPERKIACMDAKVISDEFLCMKDTI